MTSQVGSPAASTRRDTPSIDHRSSPPKKNPLPSKIQGPEGDSDTEDVADADAASCTVTEEGIAEVTLFLQACYPKMERLLPSFIASGCVNQQYIYSMATWDREDLVEFLRTHISGISGVEVYILARHFVTYFTTDSENEEAVAVEAE